MNKRVLLLLVIVACLGMAHQCLGESEESPVSFEVTADFFSKYVWRGQNVTDDWVFQPGISAAYGGLTGGFWGNLDLTDENDESGEFIEYDWYVDYSGQVNDTVGYSVGAIYYSFPGGEATTELYWGLSFDVPASPSVTVYHDVDEIDGTYVALGVGHSFEDLEDLPFGVDLSASLGWGDSSYNEGYWGADGGELNDLVLSVAFPLEIAGVSVTPSASYIALLGSDVRDAAADDDIVVVGVGLAKGF